MPFNTAFFSFTELAAQTTDLPVRFATGNFITGNNVEKQVFQKENILASFYNQAYYVLVQFSKLPSAQEQINLRNAGLNPKTYIPGNAYFATIDKTFDFSKADQFDIISLNNMPVSYKLDPAVLHYKDPGNKEDHKLIAVSYYPSVNKAEAVAAMQTPVP
ncbi:MAG: hypothetical protein IPL84_18055 [Chitinophagaceae bacterium]|nr:hypothetical protein [Chitinophagaceae bacterium]